MNLTKKSHKLGRPPTSPVDRLRIKVWYWFVRSQGWSDYKLDVEFANSNPTEKTDGANRVRTFERIRKGGVLPNRRSYDLIDRLDRHPRFKGSAAYYHSSFWDLLKSNSMQLADAQKFVTKAMLAHKIWRPSVKLEMALNILYGESNVTQVERRYLMNLESILNERSIDLEVLALVGGLFREAYLACSLETAVILKRVYSELIRKYSLNEWLGEIRNDFLEVAEMQVLYWNVGNVSSSTYLSRTQPAMAVESPLMSGIKPDNSEEFAQMVLNQTYASMKKKTQARQNGPK